MDVGLCIGSKIDDIDYVVRAEELGYSPRLVRRQPDDLVRRLRLPGRRRHPHDADPARHRRVGRRHPDRPRSPRRRSPRSTGSRRAGRSWPSATATPRGGSWATSRCRWSEFEDYVRVVRALLDGDETDFTSRGHTTKIKFDTAHLGYLDLEHHIPIYVSGFGPRAPGDGRQVRRRSRHGDPELAVVLREGVGQRAAGRRRSRAEHQPGRLPDLHAHRRVRAARRRGPHLGPRRRHRSARS